MFRSRLAIEKPSLRLRTALFAVVLAISLCPARGNESPPPAAAATPAPPDADQPAEPAPPSEAPPSALQHVAVATSKTHVTAVRITLSVDPFHWASHGYESHYTVKVFPFIFFNESGNIAINVSADDIKRLAGGQPIEFTGRAVNKSHSPRRVKGTATPEDGHHGKIRLSVFVGKMELVFKTTYAFVDAGETK